MSDGKGYDGDHAPPPSYEEPHGGAPPQYPGPTGPPSEPQGVPPQQPWAPPPQPYMAPPAQPYMGPQSQPYIPPPGQPNVVIVSASGIGLREQPVQTTCPHCSALVMTATEFKVGGMVWLIAGIILIVGCWAGCCLIPFCVDDLKDVMHSCPNCQQKIGTYHRLS